MLYYLSKAYYSIESCLTEKLFEFEVGRPMKKNVLTFGKILLEKPQNFDQVPKQLKAKGVIYELAKLIGMDMELIWCQKRFRFSYEDFLFFPLLISHVSNEKKEESPTSFKNHFLINGIVEKIDEKIVKDLEKIYYNESCRVYVESNDFFGTYQHDIVRNIRKITSFKLDFIDSSHIVTGFDDFDYNEVDVEIEKQVPNEITQNFNQWINDFVVNCHKSGVLKVNFAKEALFNLLIYLHSEYSAPHQLSFHSNIADCCPHQTAHDGVEVEFEKLLKNQQFNHVYTCFMKEELHYRGVTDGEEINSSCLALGIRDGSFEFLKYEFYCYKAVGDILS
ncbi:predicted protein [Naegleria gruberi]|uniref:Predicted protein n=1 Tax=Naegleria gruberi TaxID=5762 RepID=D2VS11_NAEGR|nr:uncharacterized protein NAEGRDRAFT_71773 [Naegleria gruberi]EFC40336.1 predicted protein [Naegleria gruberi]|eukprot:XP_002673080.1 predicted protein [Naegleria gruberi strain NEG-M]